jgi:hypothetical protein
MFNPLDHRGIPLDRQTGDWRELAVAGVDLEQVEPYVRCRIATMSGIENAAVRFDRQVGRLAADPELRGRFELLRSVEARQRYAVAGLLAQPRTVLETALTYEEAAVDLDSWLARTEPDQPRRQVYECDALEDFQHVYRYAELLDTLQRRRPSRLVDEVTEMLPDPAVGQPAAGYEEPSEPAVPGLLSTLNAITMLAIEQQTADFYDRVNAESLESPVRPVYREVSWAEREQVDRHQALIDSTASWWEQLVTREYNECRLYYAFLEQEEDRRIRALWELNLQMELAHLQLAGELLRRFDGREPEEVVGVGLADPPGFDANRAFLRQLVATHFDPDTLGSGSLRDMAISDIAQVRDVRDRLDNRTIADQDVDIVDVLTDQHSRIDALFYEIEVATDERRPAGIDELARLISAHEAAEEAVHQLARDVLPGGFDLVRDLVGEEREVRQALLELTEGGAEREDFEERLETLHDAVRSHVGHEERAELPRLRERVPVGLLRELAEEARQGVSVGRA